MMDRLHCGVPVESWMMHPLASSSYSWNSLELMNVNMAGEEVLPWLGPWMVLSFVLVCETSDIWFPIFSLYVHSSRLLPCMEITLRSIPRDLLIRLEMDIIILS